MHIIHISDVHLGRILPYEEDKAAKGSQLLWDSFSRLVALVEEKKADLLLITGDLFDRQPLLSEMEQVNYLLAGLKKTQVVILPGDKDGGMVSAIRAFSWGKNIRLLSADAPERIVFPFLDCEIIGVSAAEPGPERDKETVEALVSCALRPEKERHRYRIAMAYLPDADEGLLKMFMKGKFSYIALGGKTQPLFDDRHWASFPGSLEPLSTKETGDHGYMELELSKNALKCGLVPFSTRRFVKKTGDVPGFGEELQKLAEAHKGDVVEAYIRRMEALPEGMTKDKALAYGLAALRMGKVQDADT